MDLDADSTTASVERDAGYSFVEIVVTIVLLGTVVIAVLTAVRATVSASATARQAAEVETVLLNAVDRVTRADRTNSSIQCDLEPTVQAAVVTQGWDPASVTVVQHHRAGRSWMPGACPAAGFTEGLVQRVDIALLSPDGISRSIQVVKADE